MKGNLLLSAKRAGTIIVVALLLMLVLHLLIVLDVVPSGMVWGGQVDGTSSLALFEGVAIVTTLIFLAAVLLKVEYIKVEKLKTVASIGVWLMFVYFLLNTIGNLASESTLEKAIFTPITVVLALLALRVAMGKSGASKL